MPKIPYKTKKSHEEDKEDEIVSFEAFCDEKSPSKGRKDMLSLNDNINYRLYYESDRPNSLVDEKDGETSSREDLKETSLSGPKSSNWKRKSPSGFAALGKYCPRQGKGSLLSGVIPKLPHRAEDESAGREHRYQRFSGNRSWWQRVCEHLPSLGSGVLLLALLCTLSAGVWWAVYGTIGEAWSEEHYRRLWERAHPGRDAPAPPSPPHVPVGALYEPEPELAGPPPLPALGARYHDHNNLSTKNRVNATENSKKPKMEFNKKSAFTEKPPPGDENICSNVSDDYRFDCYPEAGASEEGCLQRGCCWRPEEHQDIDPHDMHSDEIGYPYCFYPPQYGTYRFLNMTENKHGISVYYEKQKSSAYPDNFVIVKMDFKYLSNDSLQIKIYDAENARFEPPYPQIPLVPGPINSLQYRVIVEGAKPGFKILRVSDNVTIWDTQNVGGLILSDKLLQLSALLPTHTLYGLGERRGRLLLDTTWQRHTIFNFDTVPNENTNLYGSHPFYLALEDSGQSHGVLLLNSNAMDVILQPAPAITYRTVGGILNFFVFLGPEPASVVSQYTALVGRPFMPPYWSLGFHLCKFNYGSLNVTHDVWQKTRDAGIPFDVQWNDLDYMNNSNDFTYDKVKFAGLPQFVEKLHSLGMHYIPLIDPGVSASERPGAYPPYDRGAELQIFIKNQSLLPFVGKVWNKGSTVWPDFTDPAAAGYWLEMLGSLHKEVPFDGAWIDMNEPSNFLSGPVHGSCEPENLPYMPHISGDSGLRSKTLCMDAVHHAGRHFDVHTIYALAESIATNFALTEIRGKRPFIISRSSFVGLGHYAGHWSGDVASDWHDMQMSIPELLSFSLFGVAMMGSDICGFRGNTTVELCTRWMQLGAFYPFARNHNSDTSSPQDPVSLGAGVVRASRDSLRLRYALLPYLYTLFWRAHVYGETVARPLFFEFPQDRVTHAIDQQFMLGPHVMVAPVLSPGARAVRTYLPRHRWYALNRTTIMPFTGWGTVGEDDTVILKGGSVLALQQAPARGPVSTARTRSSPMQLLVAPCDMGRAHGQLYWDDGDSLNAYKEEKYSLIDFSVSNNTLRNVVQRKGFGMPSVNEILILGLEGPVEGVLLNGAPCETHYDAATESLTVTPLSLLLTDPFTLTWLPAAAPPEATQGETDVPRVVLSNTSLF